MKKEFKSILSKELIGLDIEVIDKNLFGKIIDETKNTLKIKTKEKISTILKKNSTFKLIIKNKEIIINGDDLAKRPEDRIKLR